MNVSKDLANSNNVIRSNGINWSINQIRNRDWLPFEGRIRSRRLSGYVLFMTHFSRCNWRGDGDGNNISNICDDVTSVVSSTVSSDALHVCFATITGEKRRNLSTAFKGAWAHRVNNSNKSKSVGVFEVMPPSMHLIGIEDMLRLDLIENLNNLRKVTQRATLRGPKKDDSRRIIKIGNERIRLGK